MLDFIWFSCFLRSRGRKISPKEKNPMPFVFSPSSATITLCYCQFDLFGSGALHQAFFGSAGFLFSLAVSILLLWCRRRPILNINEAMILLLFVRFLRYCYKAKIF